MGNLYSKLMKKTVFPIYQMMQKLNNPSRMPDTMDRDSPFYHKKVIIRDDDIGNSEYFESVKWISNLCIEKDIKVTMAVIPSVLAQNPKMIEYLKSLKRNFFEFAVHGFEHTQLKGLSFEKQLEMIQNARDVITKHLEYEPFSFVPPQAAGDVNTTRALRLLGYHSITDMKEHPSYVTSFRTDFRYDTQYNPPKHRSYNEFKDNFDLFMNSSDQYYMLIFHDWNSLKSDGTLDSASTNIFQKCIDYIKSKNVQFMTLEESYQWNCDEFNVKTEKVSENKYFIDLRECRYNHLIKFNTPRDWTSEVFILDVTSGKTTSHRQDVISFEGTKGHLYEIFVC